MGKESAVTAGKKVAVAGLAIAGLGILGVLWALFGVELGIFPPVPPSSLFAFSGIFIAVGLVIYLVGRVMHWYRAG